MAFHTLPQTYHKNTRLRCRSELHQLPVLPVQTECWGISKRMWGRSPALALPGPIRALRQYFLLALYTAPIQGLPPARWETPVPDVLQWWNIPPPTHTHTGPSQIVPTRAVRLVGMFCSAAVPDSCCLTSLGFMGPLKVLLMVQLRAAACSTVL